MGGHRRRLLEVVRKRYWRECEAEVVVSAWLCSGERLGQFAREHGLRPDRVRRWAARLGHAAGSAVPFYPVRVVGLSGPATEAGDPIEIVLRDGVRVRAPEGFLDDDLRRVLTVLGHAAPC